MRFNCTKSSKLFCERERRKKNKIQFNKLVTQMLAVRFDGFDICNTGIIVWLQNFIFTMKLNEPKGRFFFRVTIHLLVVIGCVKMKSFFFLLQQNCDDVLLPKAVHFLMGECNAIKFGAASKIDVKILVRKCETVHVHFGKKKNLNGVCVMITATWISNSLTTLKCFGCKKLDRFENWQEKGFIRWEWDTKYLKI